MKKLLCVLCMCFAVACIAQESQNKQTKESVKSQAGKNGNEEPDYNVGDLEAVKKAINGHYEYLARLVTINCRALKNYKKGTVQWREAKESRESRIRSMSTLFASKIKDLHDADRKEAQALIDSKVAALRAIGGGMPKESCTECKGKGHPQGKMAKCTVCNGTGKI